MPDNIEPRLCGSYRGAAFRDGISSKWVSSPAPACWRRYADSIPSCRPTPGQSSAREGGDLWAHQRFAQFPPQVAIEVTTAPATTNFQYRPEVPARLNNGVNPSTPIPVRFHPQWPIQNPNSVWTFNGTAPPKLIQVRYGEPNLFRHHNGLPADVTQNGGFGRHTTSTHEHNGHHGAENDGFTGAFFFPNEFYDYHWPIVLAGIFSVNTAATDPRASTRRRC